MDTVLRSRSRTVTIGATQPFRIIGERINPTGRKAFAEQLRDGDRFTVTSDAVAQAQAGADLLDINAGIPLGQDPWGASWIAAHRARQPAERAAAEAGTNVAGEAAMTS